VIDVECPGDVEVFLEDDILIYERFEENSVKLLNKFGLAPSGKTLRVVQQIVKEEYNITGDLCFIALDKPLQDQESITACSPKCGGGGIRVCAQELITCSQKYDGRGVGVCAQTLGIMNGGATTK